MNSGLKAWPIGREFAPGHLGYPLGIAAESIPRMPPITDYDAWWDISDFSSLTIVSDEISQINDKSINGFNLTQGTAANRPGYGAARLRTVNGITIADFDNADWMATTLDIDLSVTMFGVFIPDNVGSATDVILGCMPATSGLEMIIASNTYALARSGTGATAMPGVVAQNGVPVVFCTAYDGATAKFALNKIRSNVAVVYTQASTSMRMGDNGSSQEFDGAIGEALVFKRYLSNTEINKMMDYLMNKWAIP